MLQSVVAKVAIDKASYSYDKLYTYLVPQEMIEKLQVGTRVTVPFGRGNKKRVALVMQMQKCDFVEEGIKPIFSMIDATPVVTQEGVAIADFLKHHTFCRYYDAVNCLLPAGMAVNTFFRYFVREDADIVKEQLGEDYVATHNNCSDPENHDHTDPNGIVDACTGLLPETTFYFYNQNHERTGSNDVIMKLVTDLLVDEAFVDVFSKPDKFPQFNVGRNSKGLMRDVAEMKEYDTSDLTEKEKALLADAIAQAEAQLDQTNVDIDAFNDAKDNFYSVRDQILNRDNEPEEKENGAYMSFGDALKQIMQFLSEILYMYFGGLGFSEM